MVGIVAVMLISGLHIVTLNDHKPLQGKDFSVAISIGLEEFPASVRDCAEPLPIAPAVLGYKEKATVRLHYKHDYG